MRVRSITMVLIALVLISMIPGANASYVSGPVCKAFFDPNIKPTYLAGTITMDTASYTGSGTDRIPNCYQEREIILNGTHLNGVEFITSTEVNTGRSYVNVVIFDGSDNNIVENDGFCRLYDIVGHPINYVFMVGYNGQYHVTLTDTVTGQTVSNSYYDGSGDENYPDNSARYITGIRGSSEIMQYDTTQPFIQKCTIKDTMVGRFTYVPGVPYPGLCTYMAPPGTVFTPPSWQTLSKIESSQNNAWTTVCYTYDAYKNLITTHDARNLNGGPTDGYNAQITAAYVPSTVSQSGGFIQLNIKNIGSTSWTGGVYLQDAYNSPNAGFQPVKVAMSGFGTVSPESTVSPAFMIYPTSGTGPKVLSLQMYKDGIKFGNPFTVTITAT